MDPLDRLAGPAAELLSRVDESLALIGAPDGHPVWPLLRRLRTLPGVAVETVVALRSEPFADAGRAVRGLRPEYDEASVALANNESWAGAGAEAFAAHRAALGAYLTGDAGSLAGRLDATAGYANALTDWVDDSRAQLARTLGEVLVSAEAVTVLGGGTASFAAAGGASDRGVLAAAAIGARVLDAVAGAYDRAEEIRQQWAGNLAELAYRPPVDTALRFDATTRIGG